ncbi:hypothetical protein ACTTAI_02475 [Rhodobacter capsulatus]|uniref:hypothetical protein n=1 Tax=Rhodobacter capsulatus TaxID=1061 RepID=UPI00402A574B
MSSYLDIDQMPEAWPTNRLSSEFWAELGRTVATFGFLEECLSKAYFALSARTPCLPENAEQAVADWQKTLEQAVSEPLGKRIQLFEKACRSHPDVDPEKHERLFVELGRGKELRDVICHASWSNCTSSCSAYPLFVSRKMNVLQQEINIGFLQTTRRATAEQILGVINVVTMLGYRFPGTNGPGEDISGGE